MNRKWRAPTSRSLLLIALGIAIGVSITGTPAGADMTSSVRHVANHMKQFFFTKRQSEARYVNVREKARRAATADNVGGIEASRTPAAGKLVPLGDGARFAPSVLPVLGPPAFAARIRVPGPVETAAPSDPRDVPLGDAAEWTQAHETVTQIFVEARAVTAECNSFPAGSARLQIFLDGSPFAAFHVTGPLSQPLNAFKITSPGTHVLTAAVMNFCDRGSFTFSDIKIDVVNVDAAGP